MKHDIQKWSPGWVRLAPRPKASQHPLRCNCAGVAARRPVRLKWFGLGVGAAAKNPRDLTPRDNSIFSRTCSPTLDFDPPWKRSVG